MSKRSSNEMVRDAIEMLIAQDLAPTLTDGKHLKISWVVAGRRHVLVISRSPSNHRARANSRATLQRLLRRPASK